MYQYINGTRTAGSAGTMPLVDPATQEAIAQLDLAGAEDIDRAVGAAAAAFPEWSRATPAERSDLMTTWAALLRDTAEELATTETRQAGKPIRLSREFDVPGTIDNVAFFAGAARQLHGLATAEYSGDHTSSIRREPIGVVGSIAPWNYPLQMAGWKILPAVAAGNTIVLKPSELTPLTSLMFAETATRAGIPAGVINVVTGTGATAGSALVSHPQVAMVSFTGSTAVGTQIASAAAGAAKRTHLELGGKAPFLVFDDADLDAAINGAVAAALINTGQDCTAATRAYVQRPLFDRFVSGVADLMRTVHTGPTLDESTDQGPLISARQRDHVSGMVERAVADGATVRCGGRRPQLPGYYYEPTLITGAAQHSEIVQREVFGPVLVALPFDTDDEGIDLANDTPYGLAASAWTSDVYRAGRASRELRAGAVWVNDHIPIISEMPHGGYKQSGYGKDMSQYSFDEYTSVKHVMQDITGVARKPWQRTVFGNDAD